MNRIRPQHAGVLFLCVIAGLAPAARAASSIRDENAKPGTTAWNLTRAATNREIEGYASRTSVVQGESIRLFVNTDEPSYTVRLFRMGWYGGAGAREVASPIVRAGRHQALPAPDAATGLLECNWTDPIVLDIPPYWTSGVYLAQLNASVSGKQSTIIFVVRDDISPASYLFQCSVTTYEAYNDWGGESLYRSATREGHATRVSFDRPYAAVNGSGEFFFWEVNMVRWLEYQGYDVTYCTDIDTHAKPDLLLSHRAFLSVGHDEYWSREMRTHVEQARDAGVNLAFFSANTCYWQIRMEPSRLTGDADRTMVCCKEFSWIEEPRAGNRSTTRWRDPVVDEPEDALVGVMYDFCCGFNGDMVIADASHWICRGTGLQDGDHLPGMIGREADRVFGHCPWPVKVLAHSPVPGSNGSADMSIYTAPSGALVIAAGTFQWSWGLDDYNVPALHPSAKSVAVQQMTRNILSRFVDSGPMPVVRLPATMAVECQGTRTSVQLDAGGSGKPTVHGLVYSWSSDCPGAFFDNPSSPATMLTFRGSGGTRCRATLTLRIGNLPSSGSTQITVSDRTPPEIGCPLTKAFYAPSGGGLPASAASIASFLARPATDTCDPNPLVTHDAPAFFPVGIWPVTFTARDASGNSAHCTSFVKIVDTPLGDPPGGHDRGGKDLWPAGHPIAPGTARAAVFRLDPPAPNPCNPTARIAFEVPRAGPVDLAVYDLLGRRVVTLWHGDAAPGRHQVVWSGRDSHGKPVAAGLYRCSLRCAGLQETRNLVILK